ncbi:MerR family DNA-binding protein [Roseinatronobacter ekhonensis]|uniref:MerR family DNA-binding protein n=1 Tax=Roseinatronobacter ekhonensis TaxID=254356 RepID=UPI0035217E3D
MGSFVCWRQGTRDGLHPARPTTWLYSRCDRELLNLSDNPDHSCADVDRIAKRQLEDVELRIARLEILRDNAACLTDHGKATWEADCADLPFGRAGQDRQLLYYLRMVAR